MLLWTWKYKTKQKCALCNYKYAKQVKNVEICKIQLVLILMRTISKSEKILVKFQIVIIPIYIIIILLCRCAFAYKSVPQIRNIIITYNYSICIIIISCKNISRCRIFLNGDHRPRHNWILNCQLKNVLRTKILQVM